MAASAVTLYVENIPASLHWKGLWHIFGNHGDIVDFLFPKKMNRKGKRFGFVRFARKMDALRAKERLQGFVLNRYKVLVLIAKYNARSSFWPKNEKGKANVAAGSSNPLPNAKEGKKMSPGEAVGGGGREAQKL
ncbi:hypothetical protein HRI_000681100 [Hibiscus trionum]|uniref:RRM domain-containing protein n=1 Tax=Hibiscus trionum TaxID=183268 RepID=A0A9W7H469_HIBTR|nr:hypothetical protein HRI_000681100 [Hibiscus trionum]